MSGSSFDPQEHWHLDKKVPISIILALLLYGIMGLWIIADIKKDVEIIKAQMTLQKERDMRQDDEHDASINLIRSQLNNIESKLDRIVENWSRKNP
jgi:Tfp pilus assembly protein PilO